MFECREVPHGSADYHAAVALRDRLLRRPLGLQFTAEDLSREVANRHFVLGEDAAVRACLMVVPQGAGVVQIRQMAVDDDCQGTGLGRRLMTETERVLRAEGIREIFLHARDTAIGFYARLGYAADGEPFTEVGIPHQKMVKRF